MRSARIQAACIVILTVVLFAGSMITPAVAQEERTPADWAALRNASMQNMRGIIIAMLNHHDMYKTYPAAYSSKEGKPLLSWRVAVLPFIDGGRPIYEQFHLDEPWDSPHNKKLIQKMPEIYRSPASKLDGGRTVYLTPRGEATLFPSDGPVPIREVRDGTSKTIALVEVEDAQAVPWTKPDDWPADPGHPKVGFRGQYPGGLVTAFADGSAHYISLDIDEGVLKALLTKDGREPVSIPQ